MYTTALRFVAGLAALLLVLMATPTLAGTQPLRLDASLLQAERSFKGHLQAYYDASGQLTQQQVASPPYVQRFERLEGGLNGGYAKGAWWVRFQIQADREQTTDPVPGGWWLRLGAPYADYLDVWLPAAARGGGAGLVQRQLGGLRPAAAREMPWTLQAVRLPDLPDAQPHWVWVRLAGDRALSLIGGVSPLRELVGLQQDIAYGTAAVIGMVLIMGFVGLMIGVAVPERRFIGYAGYLFTLALLFWTSESLQSVLWFPDHPLVAVRLHSFSVCLHTLAALACARSLLDMARQFPRFDRAFKVCVLACCVACVIALTGGYGLIAPALNLLWIAFAVSAVSLSAVLLHRSPEAWPSLVGYAVYLTVGVLHFAKNLQWLPYTLAIQYSYSIGAIVHILALFFAVGWHVRHRERKALALSQLHGDRLEQRVNRRTHDLRQEITQHRHTHDQLEVALREQKGLIAMVSHEFRTPLGTIGGAAEILSDDRLKLARDDVKSEAAKIARTVLRMRDLVDTLLADDWLQASSENVHLVRIDLTDFLREKIEQHSSDANHGRISLSVAGSGLHVMADETLLHIAMDNLLTNAIKYAPPNSPVLVSVGRQPEMSGSGPDALSISHVVIQVRDRGTGLLPEDLPHIFERFYRGKSVRRIPGIGLGLHMVERIAKIHQGKVVAANGSEGGAELTLTLPLG